MITKYDLKQGDMVYVRRGPFLEAAKVDHTYVSVTGVDCVSFASGLNAHRIDVMTYGQYWERQRKALSEVANNG